MSNKPVSTPSLLDREATGGQVAEEGFAFQAAVLLSRLPQWLADEGFIAAIREAFGDLEGSFYVPGQGTVKEFLECKNHSVTPAEFWREIRRFRDMDQASPETYRVFELVSNGISVEVRPIVNALRRLRSPGSFYENDAVLVNQSHEDFLNLVTNSGHTKEDALFLLGKVRITADFNVPAGAALFRDQFPAYHPQYGNLSYHAMGRVVSQLSTLLNSRLSQPYLRRELEETIDAAVVPDVVPPVPSTVLFTVQTAGEPGSGLRLEWEDLCGGEARLYPGPERWAAALKQLQDTKTWIRRNRRTRSVRLEGSRRLSTSIALGAVFSAVSGFTAEMNYRGDLWSTAARVEPDTPSYQLRVKQSVGAGEHLIVVVDIIRDTEAEVSGYLSNTAYGDQPVIALHGDGPVVSAGQANLIVSQVKQAVSTAVQQTGAKQIHLFFAGPAPIALLLGHRLNALAPIRCYERVSCGVYVSTWELPG